VVNTSIKPIRILVVDDNSLLRFALIEDFNLRDDFEVVGEAEHGQQAIELAERLAPDVILLDLVMPTMNGVEATAAINERYPDLPILVLTSGTEPELIDQALEAGAKTYLTKSIHVDMLVDTIRRLYKESHQSSYPDAADHRQDT
jgi:DNA-binding NarL/FixJ family response regulator